MKKKYIKSGAFYNTKFFTNLKQKFNFKLANYKYNNLTKEGGLISLFYKKDTSPEKKNKIEIEINLLLTNFINKINNFDDKDSNYQHYLNLFISIINKINNYNLKLFKYSIENFNYNKNNFLNITLHNYPPDILNKYFKHLSNLYAISIKHLFILKWKKFETNVISNKFNHNEYVTIIKAVLSSFKILNIPINIINVLLFVKIIKDKNFDDSHFKLFEYIYMQLNNNIYDNIYTYHNLLFSKSKSSTLKSSFTNSLQFAPSAPGISQPQSRVSAKLQPQSQVPGISQPQSRVPAKLQPQSQVPGTSQPQSQVSGTSQPQSQVPVALQSQSQVLVAPQPQSQVQAALQLQSQVPVAPQPQFQVPATLQPQSQVPGTLQPQSLSQSQVPGAQQSQPLHPPELPYINSLISDNLDKSPSVNEATPINNDIDENITLNQNELYKKRLLKYLKIIEILESQKYKNVKDINVNPFDTISKLIEVPLLNTDDILKNINKTKNSNTYIFTLKKNANNVLFYEKFGGTSTYGSNYKTMIIDNSFTINNPNRLINCGTKFVTCDTIIQPFNSNKKEIKLLHTVSKFALYNINPNVPIIYKSYKLDIKDYNNIAQKIYPNFHSNICNFTGNKLENANAYCYINEIFSGDARVFIRRFSHDPELLLNGISNIIISILTFWSISKKTHNDCHMGNFLYTKLKEPRTKNEFCEYNIYGKKIYVENLGFLWCSWDYGLAVNNITKNIHYNKLDFKNGIYSINSDIRRALVVFAITLKKTDHNIICNLYKQYNGSKATLNYNYTHLIYSIITNIKLTFKSDSNKYNKVITYIFKNKHDEFFSELDNFIKLNSFNDNYIDTMCNMYIDKISTFLTKIQINNSLRKFISFIADIIKKITDNNINDIEGGINEINKRNNRIKKGKIAHHCNIIDGNKNIPGSMPTDTTLNFYIYKEFLNLLNKSSKLIKATNDKIVNNAVFNENIVLKLFKKVLSNKYNGHDDKELFDNILNMCNLYRGNNLYKLIINKNIWNDNFKIDIKNNLFERRDYIVELLNNISSNYGTVLSKFANTSQNITNINHNFTDELSIMTMNFFMRYNKILFYDKTSLPPNSKIINKDTPYYIGNGFIGYRWKKITDINIINYYKRYGSDISAFLTNLNIKNLLKGDNYTLTDIEVKSTGVDKIRLIYDPLIIKKYLLYCKNNSNEFYIIDNDINTLLVEKNRIS